MFLVAWSIVNTQKGNFNFLCRKPVLKIQCCFFFCFLFLFCFFFFFFWGGGHLADAQLTKIPTPTRCEEFFHRTICKLERQNDRRWRLFVVTYWQFLLQSRLNNSIEQYNEPPKYRLHRNFTNSFLWLKSTRRMPVRRFSSYKPVGMPLKK